MDCKEECKLYSAECLNTQCRNWIDYDQDLNCALIAIEKHGSMTLHEVAKRMGVSFVRIKQIQDLAMGKINKKLKESYNYKEL